MAETEDQEDLVQCAGEYLCGDCRQLITTQTKKILHAWEQISSQRGTL